MHADNKNPGQGATGYRNEGYKDAGKLYDIGRNRLPHTRARCLVFVGQALLPASLDFLEKPTDCTSVPHRVTCPKLDCTLQPYRRPVDQAMLPSDSSLTDLCWTPPE